MTGKATAKLAGGVAVIKVGASTEIEMKEKKARVEERPARHACGGERRRGAARRRRALIRAKAAIEGLKGINEDQNHGIQIALRAMEAPLREIVTSSGDEPRDRQHGARRRHYTIMFCWLAPDTHLDLRFQDSRRGRLALVTEARLTGLSARNGRATA